VALSAPRYLADKSALARLRLPAVAARLQPLLDERAVATCSVVDLGLLYSARNATEHHQRRTNLTRTFALAPIDQAVLERAVEVQGLLAEVGAHRGASVGDVIIAAAAEAAGLTVLHYDADYDLIASVTGQPTEWVVARGEVS